MNLDDFPAPKEGFVITHVLVVADQDRSREFYRSLLGGQVLLEGDPVIIKVANMWLTLVTRGGPTDDKPGVSLGTPTEPGFTSGFLNVRVALQYTGYLRFNGGNDDYDGFGHSAADNNSLFLFLWTAI